MMTLALAQRTRNADLGLSGYGRVHADWQRALPVAACARLVEGIGSRCVRIPVTDVKGTRAPMAGFGPFDHSTFPGVPAWSPPI